MKFNNAYEGIRKIYTAGILTLVGGVVMLISAVLTLILGASNASSDLIGIILLVLGILGSVALLVVAYIINIVGVKKAALDETGFKAALLFIIAGIALSALSGVFNSANSPVADGIFTILRDINQLAVIAFIIQGIRNIADRKNNGSVSKEGQKLLLIALICYALTLIAHVVGFFPLLNEHIITIVAAVLNLFVTIVYLNYLKKALKMLER